VIILHDMQKKALKEALRLSDEAWSNQELWEKNLSAAITVLEIELENNPDCTEAMISLGALLSDSGKHQQALDVLRKAESNGSEDGMLYYNLGAVLMNLGIESREKAKAYFEKSTAMKMKPELSSEH
tara:strand:+ start:396 stop:776 length:381 start_codon:yes stop_codon:yes gene_type:complete